MGDFIQSAGKSVKVWKELGELPGPNLSTNNRNPGVPPSFCSISAEQRVVTSERDVLPVRGRTVLAHGRGRDGKKCIQLWGVWLGHLPKTSVFYVTIAEGGGFCRTAECLGDAGQTPREGKSTSAAQCLNGCLQGCPSSREWPQSRLLRSGSKL